MKLLMEDGVIAADKTKDIEMRARWYGSAVSVELFVRGEMVHSHLAPGDDMHYWPAINCVERVAVKEYGATFLRPKRIEDYIRERMAWLKPTVDGGRGYAELRTLLEKIEAGEVVP